MRIYLVVTFLMLAPAAARAEEPDSPECAAQAQGLEKMRAIGTRPETLAAIQRNLDECRIKQARDAKDRKEAAAQAASMQAVQAAVDARVQAMASDPKAIAIALSVGSCTAQDERRDALKEIATQRRYARSTGGGIVDMASIHAYQRDVREADERIAQMKDSARARHLKLLSCSDPRIVNADSAYTALLSSLFE